MSAYHACIGSHQTRIVHGSRRRYTIEIDAISSTTTTTARLWLCSNKRQRHCSHRCCPTAAGSSGSSGSGGGGSSSDGRNRSDDAYAIVDCIRDVKIS